MVSTFFHQNRGCPAQPSRSWVSINICWMNGLGLSSLAVWLPWASSWAGTPASLPGPSGTLCNGDHATQAAGPTSRGPALPLVGGGPFPWVDHGQGRMSVGPGPGGGERTMEAKASLCPPTCLFLPPSGSPACRWRSLS